MKTKKITWIIPASVLTLSLLAAAILWNAGIIGIPQFILDYFSSETPADHGQEDAALRLISDLRLNGMDKYKKSTVNSDFAQGYQAFSRIKFAENYYQAYELTYYIGGAEYTQTRKIWRSGNKWRIHVYDSEGTLIKTSISDGEQYYIRSETQSEERIYNFCRLQDFYSDAGYPSTPDLLELLGNYGSPESEISLCEVLQLQSGNFIPEKSLARPLGNFLIIIDFTYASTGQRDEYVYILDNGLLYSADSFMGEKCIYSLRTQEFSIIDGAANTDSIFMIP